MPYCAYLRKSTDREDMQVQSIDTQREWVEKISLILGKPVVYFYEDSKSAKKPGNRPEFTRMMKDIKAGKWEGVFCYTVNRIARNIPEGSDFAYNLQLKKIKEFITTQNVFTPESDTISIMIHIAQSVQYSIDLSKVTSDGQNKKAKDSGKWMWKAPAGYVNTMDARTREKFVVPDEHFETMRKIMQLVFNGLSKAEAHDKAYELGLRTRPTPKQPHAKKFSKTGFYRLFGKRHLMFYAGMVSNLKGDWYQGEHKAMVTIEAVEKYLGQNQKQYIRSEKFFPFRSLIKCTSCKTAITSQIQKKITYYHCNGYKKGCDQKKYITEKALDAQFIPILKAHTITNKDIELIKQGIVNNGEVKRVIVQDDNEKTFKKINDLEKEKVRLTRMRSKEEISYEGLRAALKEIEQEEKDLNEKIGTNQKITSSDLEAANNWIELLGSLSRNYQEQQLPEKAFLLKIFGLNFVLRDGIVSCEAVNPLFLPPLNIENCTVVAPRGHGLNKFINLIFENIEEIKTILKRLSMA